MFVGSADILTIEDILSQGCAGNGASVRVYGVLTFPGDSDYRTALLKQENATVHLDVSGMAQLDVLEGSFVQVIGEVRAVALADYRLVTSTVIARIIRCAHGFDHELFKHALLLRKQFLAEASAVLPTSTNASSD
eukprot:6214671-Pleurochrysis_carterae.AAC.6